MQSMSKMILNYHDQSDRVSTVTKTRLENDVTNHIDVVYTKNDIELSRSIKSGVIYDEK